MCGGFYQLGLLEEGGRFEEGARLVECAGKRGASAHPVQSDFALVGEFHRAPRGIDGLGDIAKREMELAEVAEADTCVWPILQTDICKGRCLRGFDGFIETADSSKCEAGCPYNKRLVASRQSLYRLR